MKNQNENKKYSQSLDYSGDKKIIKEETPHLQKGFQKQKAIKTLETI